MPRIDTGTENRYRNQYWDILLVVYLHIYIQEQEVLKTGTENRPTVNNYATYVCVCGLEQ